VNSLYRRVTLDETGVKKWTELISVDMKTRIETVRGYEG
jgi:hypothetical protein